MTLHHLINETIHKYMELSLPSQDVSQNVLSSLHRLQGDAAENWGKEVAENFP